MLFLIISILFQRCNCYHHFVVESQASDDDVVQVLVQVIGSSFKFKNKRTIFKY